MDAVDVQPEAGVAEPRAAAQPALGADPADVDETLLFEVQGHERARRLAPLALGDHPVGAAGLHGPLGRRDARPAVPGARHTPLLVVAGAVAALAPAVLGAARRVFRVVAQPVTAREGRQAGSD